MVLNFLWDIVFPRRCVGCGKLGNFICDSCRKRIEYFDNQVCPYCERPNPYGLTHPRCQKPLCLDGMFTLAHYRGPIREAIRQIKYRSAFAISLELAELINLHYDHHYTFDCFVPVPLAKKRKRKRGFNQAEKLAEALSKELGNKPVTKLLLRKRETKPQFGLAYKDRQSNVREAFAIANGHSSLVTGHSFCLVDDVATTGSTIFECAKVLKKAGASRVFAICVARGG